jgi:hypothetical protein
MKAIYKCLMCSKTVEGDITVKPGMPSAPVELLSAVMNGYDYGMPRFVIHPCGGIAAFAPLAAIVE